MKNKKIYLIIIITLLFLLGLEQLILPKINFNKESDKHLYKIEKYVSINKLKVKDEDEPTILFASDYQGENRYENTKGLISITKKYVNPNLFIMCGDYRNTLDDNYLESERGILELSEMINFNFDVPIITIQGNHDLSNTFGIPKKDYFETDKYIIYIINRDNFPNNQDKEKNSKEVVQKTSIKLEKFLKKQKSSKPIFIVTHVPLHYTNRNNGEDNKYASILFDVINKYSKNLDIVFLYGHNHSGTYDDYIGGSINYIPRGKYLNIGGTNKRKRLNFTYMNAGYLGFSNNTVTDTSTNILSISSIKIENDSLEIQRYTKDGIYYKDPTIIKRRK